MDDSFNPLDLLECDVVEEEGEVYLPEINKDETENKDSNGDVNTEVNNENVNTEVNHVNSPYLQIPEPIFDLLDYSVPPNIVHTGVSKHSESPVQEFLRPTLLGLLNHSTPRPSGIQSLPRLTLMQTVPRTWSSFPVTTMPRLVPIPRPILSTIVTPGQSGGRVIPYDSSAPHVVQVRRVASVACSASASTSSERDPLASTSSTLRKDPLASTSSDSENDPLASTSSGVETDPLAIKPRLAPLLCSHAETTFRCELHKYISKYSVTFFRLHCTSCGEHIKSTLYTVDGSFKTHKFLRVLTCQRCSGFYSNGIFPVEDGSEIYCFWCGNGGSLYCCSTCPKSFCVNCVIRNFGEEVNKQVAEKDHWRCFVCDFHMQGKQLWAHRAIPAFLHKRLKQLRSEASLLDGGEKTRVLHQDFTLCCMNRQVANPIEVSLPYSLYSKIPQHLVTNIYKMVCKPGTQPAPKKQSVIVEETRPGCVSIGQDSSSHPQLRQINVQLVDLTDDSSLCSVNSKYTWLVKLLSDSEKLMNDMKLKLACYNIYAKEKNNTSFNYVVNNLEALLKTAINSLKKMCNNIEHEKKRIMLGKSDATTNTNTNSAEIESVSHINMHSSEMESPMDPLFVSEPQVLQTENKENEFNKNNMDALNVKVNNVSSSTTLTRKRKLDMCDNNNDITDYKHLFKKYKLKGCQVVLNRTDVADIYNLKKCNVVLKKTDIIYKK